MMQSFLPAADSLTGYEPINKSEWENNVPIRVSRKNKSNQDLCGKVIYFRGMW